ncbi:RDD family protein [Emticicia sp. TH156]|uniref:RDD family protein n=1 Tax=Emticicia sp. TH156 TaxID=2067454 RepID=UPI0013044DCB|nr:RDD family protein [Emticicia sp. TH156]
MGQLILRIPASIVLLSYIRSKLAIEIPAGNTKSIMQDQSNRLLNMILDQITIIYLTFISTELFSFLPYNLRESVPLLSLVFFQLSYSFNYFMYYFIIEGCFKTTVGKVITKSTIVNADGEFISMGNAFIRTLCRYIPFEPFSFLIGSRGWHDSVSNTSVVKSFYKNDAD